MVKHYGTRVSALGEHDVAIPYDGNVKRCEHDVVALCEFARAGERLESIDVAHSCFGTYAILHHTQSLRVARAVFQRGPRIANLLEIDDASDLNSRRFRVRGIFWAVVDARASGTLVKCR